MAQDETRELSVWHKRLAGTTIAILLVAIIVAFFSVNVCDQQLTDDGVAVRVCRHLQASDPPVAAVGIVVLAILGAFFTEISAFGLSVKRELQVTKQIASENAEKIEATEQIVTKARNDQRTFVENTTVSTGDLWDGLAHVTGKMEPPPDPAPAPAPTPAAAARESETKARIKQLADEYNKTRRTMPPGSERTNIMTTIGLNMKAALQGASDIDVREYLQSDDRGLRLAGFEYLIANPAPARTPELVDAIVKEDKPFGHYWGLNALREQLRRDPNALGEPEKRRLEDRFSDLAPETDRARLLRRVLEGRQL